MTITQTFTALRFDLASYLDGQWAKGRSVPTFHLWHDDTLDVWRLDGRFFVSQGDDGFFGFDVLKLDDPTHLNGTYASLRKDTMHHGVLRLAKTDTCTLPPAPAAPSASVRASIP